LVQNSSIELRESLTDDPIADIGSHTNRCTYVTHKGQRQDTFHNQLQGIYGNFCHNSVTAEEQ